MQDHTKQHFLAFLLIVIFRACAVARSFHDVSPSVCIDLRGVPILLHILIALLLPPGHEGLLRTLHAVEEWVNR
jgi:hypothetical protein